MFDLDKLIREAKNAYNNSVLKQEEFLWNTIKMKINSLNMIP